MIVAVDLGTQRIKGIVARKNEDGKFEVLASESIESKGIRNGMVANMSEAAYAVRCVLTMLENKEPLRSLGATIEQIYVGLGGKSIQTIEHTVTRVFDCEDEEVTQEIIDEMRRECLQIQIGSNSEKKVEILDILPQEYLVDDCTEHDAIGFCCRNLQGKYRIVVALAELRRNLIRAIKEKAGVEIAGMFISPMAMSKTMLTPKEMELGSVFLDFGAGTTSVSIYENHYLRYVAVIPFGGNELTEDLRELNLVSADAEKLKLNHGNAMSELETDTNIYVSPVSVGMQGLEISTHLTASILEARLTEILGFVQKHIEKSGYAGRLRAGVVIGGGASNLKNTGKLVSRELGMEARHCHYDITTQIENFDYHSFAQLIALLNFAQTSCIKIKEQPKAEKPKRTSIIDKFIKRTGIAKTADKVKETVESGLADIFNDDANVKM